MNSMHRRALVLFCLLAPVALRAQDTRAQAAPTDNEVSLAVEPLAGGAQYLHRIGGRVYLGVAVTAGPLYGVVLSRGDFGRLREWATLYPVLAYRLPSGIQAFLSPIGAALAVGDDFGSVYPSAQAGLELGRGRLRMGTVRRGVRIATGNGGGSYRVQWVPLRLGYTLN